MKWGTNIGGVNLLDLFGMDPYGSIVGTQRTMLIITNIVSVVTQHGTNLLILFPLFLVVEWCHNMYYMHTHKNRFVAAHTT